MVKKLEILGIELDNQAASEAMLKAEAYLDSAAMNVVEAVSMRMLAEAQSDEALRACISSLDLAIIQDPEILKAAGETDPQRIRETEEMEFQREFLRYAGKSSRTAYLLGETKEQVAGLGEFLRESGHLGGRRGRGGGRSASGRLKVAGSYALEDCEGDYDKVNNEINIAEPDIILSIIPSPLQENFLMENKEKLNAKIWYGMGEGYRPGTGEDGISGFLRRLARKGRMWAMMLNYRKE